MDKCIQTYLKDDELELSNGGTSSRDLYKCEKCKKGSRAKIKTELTKLPNILVFHMKRFQFPSMKKITGKIKYGAYLKMDK